MFQSEFGPLPRRGRADRRRLLLAPVVVIYGVVLIWPLLNLGVRSVRVGNEGWTLGAYVELVQSSAFRSVLGTSVWVALAVTFWSVVLGYSVAYAIHRISNPRVRGLLLGLIVLPILTGALIRSFAWIAMLENSGVVNSVLISVGLLDEPLQLVYNRTGLYIGMVSVMLPFAILPMTSTMLSIDKSLVSAASSLGASPRRQFLHVFLPLSLPGVMAGALLTFILSVGFYITPALLGGRRETMVAQLIESRVLGLGEFSSGAAMAWVVMGTVVAMLVIYSRFFSIDNLFGSGRR